jgi:cytochrome c-type biogenesis protein CcmH/NrfG
MPDKWMERLTELQKLLALCPTDILSRCELAMLLEQLEQHEEALFHWKAVIATDPNNLKAREGVARCRTRTGQSL